jgi:hypothetical protein
MRWKFSKPKNPGFGLSSQYYYSVLSATAQLPSVLQVANPQGEGGAVVGFGAPLASGATKDDLNKPMERGAYVLATKDRKTVLKLIVVPKEEAGFDPEAFLSSSQAADLGPEMASRIRATWTLLQLTYEAHDPMVYGALDFFNQISQRLADLTGGVIADPLARRYMLPQQVFVSPRADEKVDAREHVSVAFRAEKEGIHAFTLGMQKFVLPEFEVYAVPDDLFREAEAVLFGLAQAALLGQKIVAGDIVGGKEGAFEVREGGLDRALWEGIAVHELLPARGSTVENSIRAMARG